MNRKEYEEESKDTYIKSYDSIRWYYHIVKKCKSDCIIDVLNYLLNLQDEHKEDKFEADRNYISNRLLYKPDAIGDALKKLEDDKFIYRDASKGRGTYVKVRYETILKIAELYHKSDEYKSWQPKIKKDSKTLKVEADPVYINPNLPFPVSY